MLLCYQAEAFCQIFSEQNSFWIQFFMSLVALQVCVWQELQSVRKEIFELEEEKRLISETVKTLVVRLGSSEPQQ